MLHTTSLRHFSFKIHHLKFKIRYNSNVRTKCQNRDVIVCYINGMTYAEQIQHAVNYIEGHLTQELRLSDIAQVAGFSSWHFQRSLDKLQHTIQYIHHAWLPKSNYILDNRPEIEWYDKRFFPDSEASAFDILIPICSLTSLS